MKEDVKIAVISDTHGLIREEVRERIGKSNYVIHCGDFCSEDVYEDIKKLTEHGRFYAVKGNNDRWSEYLPESLEFDICGKSFFVTHRRIDIPKGISSDFVLYGHSHKYFCEKIEINGKNQLWLNPGSCGRRRFTLPVTMAELHIKNGSVTVERIEIESGGSN